MSAAVLPAVCPGCNFPVSEMERLTGKCAKDNLPLDQPREEFAVPAALTPETVEVGMGVTWSVGSDRYAATVTKVSKSGKTFEFTDDKSVAKPGHGMPGLMYTLAGMPLPSTDSESIESVLERVDTYLTALNDPDREE